MDTACRPEDPEKDGKSMVAGMNNSRCWNRRRRPLSLIALMMGIMTSPLLGCTPGNRLTQRQFAFQDPAVKWVFHIRDRLGWQHYLYLPGAVTLKSMGTTISGESVDDSSVSFWAMPRLETCSDAPFESAEFVRLDLDTGNLLKGVRPQSPPDRTHLWALQYEGARVAGEPEVFSKAEDAYLKWHDRNALGAIRILRLRSGALLGTGGKVPSVGGGSDSRAVFVTSENYVICVDMEALESTRRMPSPIVEGS